MPCELWRPHWACECCSARSPCRPSAPLNHMPTAAFSLSLSLSLSLSSLSLSHSIYKKWVSVLTASSWLVSGHHVKSMPVCELTACTSWPWKKSSVLYVVDWTLSISLWPFSSTRASNMCQGLILTKINLFIFYFIFLYKGHITACLQVYFAHFILRSNSRC